MYVRGKPCRISKHAFEGMRSERPPLDDTDVALVLGEPNRDDGRLATRRMGARTILVYYAECEDEIVVRCVSATRSHVPA